MDTMREEVAAAHVEKQGIESKLEDEIASAQLLSEALKEAEQAQQVWYGHTCLCRCSVAWRAGKVLQCVFSVCSRVQLHVRPIFDLCSSAGGEAGLASR